MNDTNFTNNLINIEIPDSVAELAEDVIGQPVTTFKDLWFLVFGGISQKAQKRKMKYKCDLDAYARELEIKIAAIPEGKRIEPSLQVTGQALDDSRYCIDSEALRRMFANLIASSMNKDYEHSVHPSFPKLIQQMSPMDAHMLSLFHIRPQGLAIANFIMQNENNSFNVFDRLVPELMPENCSIEQASLSIASLQHLGLVNASQNEWFTDDERYSSFYLTPGFQELKRQGVQIGQTAEIQKGIARLTPLGESFISVCLPHETLYRYKTLPTQP